MADSASSGGKSLGSSSISSKTTDSAGLRRLGGEKTTKPRRLQGSSLGSGWPGLEAGERAGRPPPRAGRRFTERVASGAATADFMRLRPGDRWLQTAANRWTHGAEAPGQVGPATPSWRRRAKAPEIVQVAAAYRRRAPPTPSLPAPPARQAGGIPSRPTCLRQRTTSARSRNSSGI